MALAPEGFLQLITPRGQPGFGQALDNARRVASEEGGKYGVQRFGVDRWLGMALTVRCLKCVLGQVLSNERGSSGSCRPARDFAMLRSMALMVPEIEVKTPVIDRGPRPPSRAQIVFAVNDARC